MIGKLVGFALGLEKANHIQRRDRQAGEFALARVASGSSRRVAAPQILHKKDQALERRKGRLESGELWPDRRWRAPKRRRRRGRSGLWAGAGAGR